MRISLATLDPASSLGRRVAAALARDMNSRPALGRSSAPVPASEEELHRAIVAMLAVEAAPGVVAFHPANGGRRGKAEAGRFKGMGVLPGIPDLIVIVGGRAHGLEIKTAKGRMSEPQKAMAQRFTRAGAAYEVARSIEDARRILCNWRALAR